MGSATGSLRSDLTARTLSASSTLDARTATDWGLLRTFVQVDIRRRTGAWYGSGTSMRQGFGIGYGGGVNPNGGFPSYGGVNSYSATGGIQLESSVNVDQAFVQWGGLTAGRFQSFFDFYADNDNYHGMGDSDVDDRSPRLYLHLRKRLLGDLGDRRRQSSAATSSRASARRRGQYLPERLCNGPAFANYAITFPRSPTRSSLRKWSSRAPSAPSTPGSVRTYA